MSSASQALTMQGVAERKGCGADGLGFWALVKEDLATYRGDWTRPGFRALFVYRFGVARFGFPAFVRKPMTLLYRMMQRHVRNHYGIEMYDTATIGRWLEIGHQGAIVIHEYAVIGNDCIIRQAVTIGAAGSWSATTAPILGDHVDVGAGAKILGKIKVGDNTRIGPNVVLMTDLPAGAIAFVEPPRVLHLKARPDVRADPGRV